MLKNLKLRLKKGWIYTNAMIWDRWQLDQQIPLQTINRTLFDYDVHYFGRHEPYAPALPDDHPVLAHRDLALHYTPQYLDRPYFYEIENAVVYRGVIYDAANPKRLILEGLPEVSLRREGKNFPVNYDRYKMMARAAKKAQADIETGYLFSGFWWRNYYHFVADYATRYAGLVEEGVLPDQTRILLDQEPLKWQAAYFELFGLKDHPFVYTRDEPVKVRRLIVASPRRHRFACSPDGIAALRKLVLRSVDDVPQRGKRIYISRQNATTRRITNEAALASMLERNGFETCILENMSVPEQIRTFAAAEAVIAPHGAGLVNLVFSTAPTVIELLPTASWDKGFFIALTNSIGGNHIPVVSSAEGDNDDFEVDVPYIERVLQRQLQASGAI